MKKNPHCTGVIEEPFLTLSELKEHLLKEWTLSHQSSFRILKEAVINPPVRAVRWKVADPATGAQQSLTVRFV